MKIFYKNNNNQPSKFIITLILISISFCYQLTIASTLVNLNQNNNFADNNIIYNHSNLKPQLITLDFQNADVKHVLRTICYFGRYNLVMSDTVQGKINLKLEKISWQQALSLVLKTQHLGIRVNGNILRIAPNQELLDQDKIILEQDKLQDAVDTLITISFKLKYIKANLVKDMISNHHNNNELNINNKQNSPILSNRGSLLVDERSNIIFITDSQNHILAIKKLLHDIDIPVKQVLISARIVQADKNLESDLGSRIMALNKGKLSIANNLNNAIATNQKLLPQQPLITNFNEINPSLATIFSPTSSLLLGLELDAAELTGNSKTLSYPKIITSSYQTANIQQGMKIPYHNTSMSSSTTVTEFINASLSFTVTPQITEAGTVILDIEVHKDHPLAVAAGVTPPIDTNQISTKVEIIDGATLLIGGVFIDDYAQGQYAIPFLSKIPYLGWLFKQNSTKSNQKELLIYITPKILNP